MLPNCTLGGIRTHKICILSAVDIPVLLRRQITGHRLTCGDDIITHPQHFCYDFFAPRPRFELGTNRLTVYCSTAELPRNLCRDGRIRTCKSPAPKAGAITGLRYIPKKKIMMEYPSRSNLNCVIRVLLSARQRVVNSNSTLDCRHPLNGENHYLR